MNEIEDLTAQQGGSPASPPGKSASGFENWTGFVCFAGIILPLVAIISELVFHILSRFHDAIPTIWHLLLLATVPISSALAVLLYWRRDTRYAVAVTFLAGLALARD